MRDNVDKEIVSSQMNWFQIETRIRKMIHKILKPTLERAHEDRETMLKSDKNLKFHSIRLDEIESYLFTPIPKEEKKPEQLDESKDKKSEDESGEEEQEEDEFEKNKEKEEKKVDES